MATPAQSRRIFRFGVFEIDTGSGELRKQGTRIKLQEQPFQVLAMLLERPGEVVTREELRDRLWSAGTFVDFDDGVNTAIKKIRDVLGDSAESPRFVETLPRRGYRFIASMDNGQSPTAQLFGAPDSRGDNQGAAACDISSSSGVAKAWRRKVQFATVAVAIAGASLLFGLKLTWHGRQQAGTPSSTQIHSIAVIPLENLTGDSGQEYFVDGMTDALITDLAQIRSLRVISRTSTMQYKRASKPLPEIARELNVDAVLEGSVVRSNDQVRIDAQLILAATDQHLWAKSYQSQLRDVVSMQNDIARAVAEEVQTQITPEEKIQLTAARPVTPGAYEDYLKGRYYLRGKGTSEAAAKAFEHFQKATVEDPNYAPAYAGLAAAELRRPFLEPLPPRQTMPRAAQAARKALQLDPSLAEAHAVLAAIKYRFDWDWAGADAEFKQALELNRNRADVDTNWEYIVFLRTANRYQEAIDEAKRGKELAKEFDPALAEQRLGLGTAYLIARKYDLAIPELRQNVARNPDGAVGYYLLAVGYEQKGLAREAISALEQSVKISRSDPVYLAMLAHAYATFGRKQDAEKILAQLQQRARREYVSPFNIALVWTGLGNKQQALAWLEKAHDDRSFPLVTINSWPWFDPLRSDPHFQDLVRRIGLDPDRAIPR